MDITKYADIPYGGQIIYHVPEGVDPAPPTQPAAPVLKTVETVGNKVAAWNFHGWIESFPFSSSVSLVLLFSSSLFAFRGYLLLNQNFRRLGPLPLF